MKLKTIIMGLSVFLSCVFVADILTGLGVPEYFGDVPVVVVVATVGIILMMQGRRSRR